MDQEQEAMDPGNIPTPTGADWAAFVQQQVQMVLQAALPQIIQQITDHTADRPQQATATWKPEGACHGLERHSSLEQGNKESKVADPEKFSGKKGNEVYRWFAQLRLVFRGKSRMYSEDEDKVAFALSYMTGAAQNWAMPLLQALDEGREHVLLRDYAAFREAVIGVYGDLDRRGNAEDRLGRLRQTGSVASYISTFNEYAAQVEWNESSLVARFRGGLKDEILDSVATAESQPRKLQDWIMMASRIDERLWGRRQARRPTSDSVYTKSFIPRESAGRSAVTLETSGPVPMELGAVRPSTASAKTAADRLEYQKQGRCWGCGELGHVRSKCPTNPSRPLSLAATRDTESGDWGKDAARD